jgi:chromodomain-helicase-DNA-binding protein 4
MSHYHTKGFDEPEDPNAMAAQQLSQVEDPSFHAVLTAGDTGQETRESRDSESSPAREAPPFEIVPPVVSNSNDYEYLPGHFAVHRILELDSSIAEKPLYTVRLQSGERETVISNQLFFHMTFRLTISFSFRR